MAEEFEIYKFNFENMDKVEEAYQKMGQAEGKKSISGLAKEIVCYGLRKKPEELKTLDAVKILELFERVMEVNSDFFSQLKGATAEKIIKIMAPELLKSIKEQSTSSSQEKESVHQN